MTEIPFALKWTILKCQLSSLKDSVNGRLNSTLVSNIPEFQYYMAFYPNGHRDERRGETWIFLHLQFKNVKKVEVDFTVTIESANFSHTDHEIYEESEGRGIKICETNEFFDPEKKFFVDKKFTVKVNAMFKFETENDAIPAAIKEQKWMGGKLGDEFWAKNDTKDFTIITSDSGKEIKVHKSVLDIRSEVFTAMLNSNMKEATENKVTIPNFPFIVVEIAIKLIYDCNFTSNLSMDELMLLLQFFDKYLLPELKAKVEPYLISQISPSTVVRLTNYSIQTNSFKLKAKCAQFLWTAFDTKIPFADFDELDKDIAFKILKNLFHGILEIEEQ